MVPLYNFNRFIAVLFIYARLLLNTADARTIKVHDPKIDVVLMYDQTREMEKLQNEIIWDDMNDWIERYYYSGRDDTRFAVIGCGDNNVALDFDDLANDNVTDKAKKIIAATEEVRKRFGNVENIDLCLTKLTDETFTSDQGDRADAPNVAIYVSDCQSKKDDHDSSTHIRFQETCKQWLWLCVKGGAYSDDDVMRWLEGKRELVLNYTDKASFVARLDQFSDYLIDKEVWDCEWDKNISATQCEVQNGMCVKTEYPNIIEAAGPEDAVGIYVNACSMVVPPNATLNCEQEQCPTTMSEGLSVQGGSARKGSKRPEERPGTKDISNQDPKPDPGGRATEGNAKSKGLLIGVVVGVLAVLLLIIIVIVVVVLMYRKKKKTVVAKKGKINLVDRKIKERDVTVSVDQSEKA